MLHVLVLSSDLPGLQLQTRGRTAPGQKLLVWLVIV